MARKTINLIGTGRVGQTIFRLLADTGDYDIQDVYSRTTAKADAAVDFIGAGTTVTALEMMRPADIWFVTVPDTQISTVAGELAAVVSERPAIAIHCSGFLPASALQPLGERGWKLVSAHPVLSFADPAISIDHFAGIYCGLEGDPEGVETAAGLFSRIGARPFAIKTSGKALYHAAAVLSNNLTVVLQAAAREAWAEAGVPEEVIGDLHAGLLRSGLENVLALGPAEALTGPAARNDWSVVERQHRAVEAWHPEMGAAYIELSRMARRLKAGGSTLPAADDKDDA